MSKFCRANWEPQMEFILSREHEAANGRVRLRRTPNRSSHGSTESRPTLSKLRGGRLSQTSQTDLVRVRRSLTSPQIKCKHIEMNDLLSNCGSIKITKGRIHANSANQRSIMNDWYVCRIPKSTFAHWKPLVMVFLVESSIKPNSLLKNPAKFEHLFDRSV
jgi:hypothetical protein